MRYSGFTLDPNYGPDMMSATHFFTKAEAYASVFGGGLMRKQTDTDWAWGAGVRLSAGIGLRFASMYIDGFAGTNRPETLSRLPWGADELEFGLGIHARVGF